MRNKYSMIEYKGLLTCFGGSLDAQEGYEFLRKALRDMGGDTELQMVRTGCVERAAHAKTAFFYACGSDVGLKRKLCAWERCSSPGLEASRTVSAVASPASGRKADPFFADCIGMLCHGAGSCEDCAAGLEIIIPFAHIPAWKRMPTRCRTRVAWRGHSVVTVWN